MTIIESAHLLLEWFQKNDAFNLEDHFKELLPNHISLSLEADKASIICALGELEKNEILKPAEIEKNKFNKKYWILAKPLASFDQNVTLSYNTCLILSEIAKKAAEHSGNSDILINPSQITEKDILLILQLLMQEAQVNLNKGNNEQDKNNE